MRKNIIIIGILLLSLITISILLLNTFNSRNGFKRIYISNDIVLSKEFNLKSLPVKIKDICNIDDKNKYLYISTFDPRFYFIFDDNLNLLDTLKIGFDTKLTQYVKSGFDASVVDSVLLIYAKNGGFIIRHNIGSDTYNTFSTESKLITKSVTLDNTYSTLRIFNKDNSQSFIKINNQNGKEVAKGNILDSDIKSGFSTDGMLVSNHNDSLILYIQYYTNKFYCLNKNLELVYESHTIDTIYHNPIENGKFHTKKSGQFMPEVPLKIINKYADSYEDKLIINSSLIADNDPLNLLQNSYIFDIYSALNGNYISSITIPKNGTKSLHDFKVYHNKLILLCDNKLLIINANLP
ncbi:hypothetical protein COR50_02015 [Chitinophaga caeni]|uniref:Uncharacterized protein n=1 Tax=Chitinophaga caeni TaxID=2029983 RepID=A0A291QQ62_9BACT|nr:hypothetical protein [Chitinophaga caeni]ATL46033.1 hypothetical protein COR50_02015 [Chitinophaga caeni]